MASNTNRKRSVTGPEIGESGVQIFNGIITGEEYNSKLTGINAIRIYDEMRRSDATVGATLKAVKLPVKSTKWYMESASDEDKDVEIKDFVHYNLFESIKWQKTINEILTFLEFGFSVFEMVLEAREVDGKLRIVLKKLAFRKQTTITAWDAGTGVPGVTQMTTDGKTFHIPLNKIIVFTNEQEGDNYAGRSILRAAYKHWFYKDKLYQIDAVGHERQALGVVKIKYPTGASDKQREAAKAAAMNLRANEEAYIEEPVGWDINFMDMKAGTLKDIHPSVDHHDRQISKNVLAQFLEIGASKGSGTRSTSEDHSKLFLMANEAIAAEIADTMNYVIKTLVDLNFTTDSYPTLRFGKFDEDNVPQIADAVTKFTDAGMLTPTEEDEDHVRAIIGFPEREHDNDEDASEKKEAAKDKKSANEIKKKVEAARKLHASVTEELYGDTARAA